MSKVNTKHYRQHPSGIECIDITRHMGFNLGNALKYIWRADLKNESPVEDLKKATWYLLDELLRITGDSYYLNKRSEIENYTASIEPLKGLEGDNVHCSLVLSACEPMEVCLDEAEVRRTAHKDGDLEC